MSSIFSKIVSGEIPAYKVAETDKFLAFLDVFPIKRGHTLIIPKEEVDYIFNLDDETFAGLHLFSKIVAKGVEKTIPCKRIATAVIGLEVPHVHIHLVPMDEIADLDFTKEKLKLEKSEFEQIAADIQAALKELN